MVEAGVIAQMERHLKQDGMRNYSNDNESDNDIEIV
jgi:hypothetical protein